MEGEPREKGPMDFTDIELVGEIAKITGEIGQAEKSKSSTQSQEAKLMELLGEYRNRGTNNKDLEALFAKELKELDSQKSGEN